ncbi:TetR family transcriptional regulator C-terminal domain-containing protein [Nonomuraea sp. NPDC049158]|uniref:TetR/AcrR family transcriptional regulator n=1 Tax=Nonomuraea sp. NPDC049158 TaxID=3155649 RepID=UPI0034026D4F
MKRSETVADTAITLLAERGMRGLTHRAVDEAAGLPPGSTSNLARTRAALLELTLSRLTDLEVQALAPVYRLQGANAATDPLQGANAATDPFLESDLPGLVAEALHVQLADRRRTLARYELALEATRRPELRKIYDEAGRRFRDPVTGLLGALGSPDPVRHGRQLVAFGEGIMFDAIAGAGTVPSLDDLREAVRDLLRGMLGSGT